MPGAMKLSARSLTPVPRLQCPWQALALSLALLASSSLFAARTTLSLDGAWHITDGSAPDQLPVSFPATVPVPGLANLAQPGFQDVDRFISRENLVNRIRSKLVPEEWLTQYWKGKVDQDRNYFWYQKSFRAPGPHDVALLKISKAQFGTAVWLNGRKLGEYPGCFTASHLKLNEALRWNQDNSLVVRIGAHPAVLPDTYPAGSDFEKIKWTAGIYDSVSVIFCDSPAIESIQVAPRVATGEILVQSRLRNHGLSPVTGLLTHQVKSWSDGLPVASGAPDSYSLQPGEEKVLSQTIRIPQARLWSPQDPFLYVVDSRTEGDSVSNRFGMREFRFDAATGRAYLNGQVYYLRGSNITLHRFFEDPLCRDLPWNERWVRRLLADVPKQMHWNYFRFCIGPVPDRWLDICDEAGLLIQSEFFVWTGGPAWYKGYSRSHDADEMIRQYRDWMRDQWNHPSVVVWDANNETKDDIFGARIIPAVRPLDLSNRPWENSYNPPAGPDDPVEDHPYLMSGYHFGNGTFQMSDLEKMDGRPRPGVLPSTEHPRLINEYGWLWLNRDGSPTRLTEKVYAHLLGTNATPRQRLDLSAYLLAGKTEFWRAHRQYAGIIHFVYLTCSYPGVYTADHFADVTELKLDPAFPDYLGEAFKPLGAYLNFFQPTLTAGSRRTFRVLLVNDEGRSADGTLTLTLEDAHGTAAAEVAQEFALGALGDCALDVPFTVPPALSGRFVLKAAAQAKDPSFGSPTRSRRWITVAPP